MARVAIVIVTYNSSREIGKCLDSLRDLHDIETVVVDNASNDGTREEAGLRNVKLIANPDNAGFAAAVNRGVRATSAPLVLLLNPDAQVIQGLHALAAEFEDPATGIAGGLLIGPDGKPQTGFMARSLPTVAALSFEVLGINSLWPRNPVNWHYRCLGLDPVTPALVEQPAGAFLMFSRGIWEKVGGFDERFQPLWFEDVDFCTRVARTGARVRYNPAAVAIHEGAHSARALPLEIREGYWYGNLLEYAALHFGPVGFRLVCVATFVGAICRALRGCLRDGSKAVLVYGAVCRLAIRRMFSRSAGLSE